MSTGVTTEFDNNVSESMQPRYKLDTPEKKGKSSSEEIETIDCQSEDTCPKCQKFYIRPGNMLKHVNTEKCTHIIKE